MTCGYPPPAETGKSEGRYQTKRCAYFSLLSCLWSRRLFAKSQHDTQLANFAESCYFQLVVYHRIGLSGVRDPLACITSSRRAHLGSSEISRSDDSEAPWIAHSRYFAETVDFPKLSPGWYSMALAGRWILPVLIVLTPSQEIVLWFWCGGGFAYSYHWY